MKIEPIWQPAQQQRIFRALMEAMARPGTIHDIGAWLAEAPAWRGVLACLLDAKSSLADCHHLVEDSDWPLLQARPERPEAADYLLCQGSQEDKLTAKMGSLSCPDQSATLVIQVANLGEGPNFLTMRGPGIPTSRNLAVGGLAASWLTMRDRHLSFPLGIDLILADQQKITAIPRTTRLENTP
ncbi:MAG: phosphonate C-P lyase system protein PhnH [Desulfobulbaceae bacterium]|nr:MAG: phosphonate C-P lyase system protein PhnH [Desulfobulbaceae bacterium]